MAKPPYGSVAGIAKHGTDEHLLAARDDIRWLARWTDDVHHVLSTVWRSADVTIGAIDDDNYRKVTLSLNLSQHELATLLHLLDEDDE